MYLQSNRFEKLEEPEIIRQHGCRICGSEKLYKFLSLGPTPLANSFLKKDQLSLPEPYYSLDVYFCNNCGLVQLIDIVPPEILFKEYAYLTGQSNTMKLHFAQLARKVTQRFNLNKDSLVVDIGSNDGTLLQNFRKYNIRTLGVEPATNISKLAVASGIETVNDFFNKASAQKIAEKKGEAKVILGTNVFAHQPNLHDFLSGVDCLLDEDGAFIIEVPYLLDLLNNTEFDTIYHEHLSYFALRPLITLFKKFDMQIFDVERVSVHGGTVRVYVGKSAQPQSKNVHRLIRLEKEKELHSKRTYLEFSKKVDMIRQELLKLLKNLQSNGLRIVGYGAPAKGNTLLNYCKIGPDIIEYTIDTTPFKQRRFTPGMHIPIFSEKKFHEDRPDYTLILAWNYAEEIIQKESAYLEKGGRFILPIPHPQIIP